MAAVRDGVIRRAVGKWLNAGVMEDGVVSRPDRGTPQGGVISPLLANIYLHTVLDTWFETEVRPRLRGGSFMVRYADDAVLCFADEADARRVMEVLPKRLARFGLALNERKTRLVEFKPPGRRGERAESTGASPWGDFGADTHRRTGRTAEETGAVNLSSVVMVTSRTEGALKATGRRRRPSTGDDAGQTSTMRTVLSANAMRRPMSSGSDVRMLVGVRRATVAAATTTEASITSAVPARPQSRPAARAAAPSSGSSSQCLRARASRACRAPLLQA